MSAFLEIKNLTKEYHNHVALRDISFDIQKNAVFGLLGPNGAGKTTLIRIIAGIYKQTAGQVLLEGIDSSKQIQKLGYLPEERGLYQNMYVDEYLHYIANLRGLAKNETLEKINYWIETFQLIPKRKNLIGTLSKGNQQKIQFIASVLHNPDFIILDEPFSGFDPINEEILKKEIIRLYQEGKTILFSTHRMESVEELCTHVGLIHGSKLLLNGKVEDIKQQYDPKEFIIETKNEINHKELTLVSAKNGHFQHKISATNFDDAWAKISSLGLSSNLVGFYKRQISFHEIFLKLTHA